jgi:OCT family organic cation transporter-like MFS transporter 13
MFFFGWFSDTYGRLPTIMITNMIALVAGIATPFVTGHFSFITLRFVMGLAYNTCFTGPYVLGDQCLYLSFQTNYVYIYF